MPLLSGLSGSAVDLNFRASPGPIFRARLFTGARSRGRLAIFQIVVRLCILLLKWPFSWMILAKSNIERAQHLPTIISFTRHRTQRQRHPGLAGDVP